MFTSCVSYTMDWPLPSASAPINMIKAAVVVSGITYQIHINGYSVRWYTSSRFSIYMVNISYVQMMIFHGV